MSRFNPRAGEGATTPATPAVHRAAVSTHAPVKARPERAAGDHAPTCFNARAGEGATRCQRGDQATQIVSPHAPEGATDTTQFAVQRRHVSTHAREGATQTNIAETLAREMFQPTRPQSATRDLHR